MVVKAKIILPVTVLAIFLVILWVWTDFRQIGKLQYTIVDMPPDEMLSVAKCKIAYLDNVSLDIGKSKSTEDVVERWSNSVESLEKEYYTKYMMGEQELYGNFLWTNAPKSIQLRYRNQTEGYEREGWYIFTQSPALFQDYSEYGEFFISKDGVLMPVMQTCTIINCCP